MVPVLQLAATVQISKPVEGLELSTSKPQERWKAPVGLSRWTRLLPVSVTYIVPVGTPTPLLLIAIRPIGFPNCPPWVPVGPKLPTTILAWDSGARARRAKAATQGEDGEAAACEGAPLPSTLREDARVARAPRPNRPRLMPLPEVDPADDAFAWRLTCCVSSPGSIPFRFRGA